MVGDDLISVKLCYMFVSGMKRMREECPDQRLNHAYWCRCQLASAVHVVPTLVSFFYWLLTAVGGMTWLEGPCMYEHVGSYLWRNDSCRCRLVRTLRGVGAAPKLEGAVWCNSPFFGACSWLLVRLDLVIDATSSSLQFCGLHCLDCLMQ